MMMFLGVHGYQYEEQRQWAVSSSSRAVHIYKDLIFVCLFVEFHLVSFNVYLVQFCVVVFIAN